MQSEKKKKEMYYQIVFIMCGCVRMCAGNIYSILSIFLLIRNKFKIDSPNKLKKILFLKEFESLLGCHINILKYSCAICIIFLWFSKAITD